MKKILLILLIIATYNALGQKLISYKVECESGFDEEKYEYANRIVEKKFQENNLKIIVTKLDNCNYTESIGYVELIGDTLFLNYKTKNDYLKENPQNEVYQLKAACNCPLRFEYLIENIKTNEYIVKLNNNVIEAYPSRFKTYKITFIIENNDTINFKDEYKLKQGKWIERDSINNISSEFYYKDNEILNGIRKRYRADNSLEIIENFVNRDSILIEFYDKSERLIKSEIRK